MLYKTRFALVVLCALLQNVASFEFEDAQVVGVKFGNQTTNAQLINVDEKNAGGTTTIVLITGVQGNLQINSVTSNGATLGVDKEQDSSDLTKYYLTANLLNFEDLIAEQIQTNFIIDVIDNDDTSTRKSLSVNINNLDDESPTLITSNCLMNEEEFIGVDTSTCIFQINDADGWLNQMDYSGITGTRDESSLFELVYKEEPGDTVYQWNVSLVLKEGKKLDYESVKLYTFHVDAKDGASNPTAPISSIPIIVQVQDMPDQPPAWDGNFRSAITITEKTETKIQVSAKDGDIGINNNITYQVTGGNGFVRIDEDTGLITVAPIDRDAGNDQVNFNVIAIEVEQPNSTTSSPITLMVEDLDDHIPEISVGSTGVKEINLTVNENTSDLRDLNISVSDIDLGENAIYDIILQPTTGTDFTEAFVIIPGKGYYNTSVTLSILDPSKLDYEDPDWRVITMQMYTVETKNESMSDLLPISIKLIDINDEWPVFDPPDYTVKLLENVTAGTLVKTILATDRDAEDISAGLRHELLGTMANNMMKIDLDGNITTIKDHAFDYEKQTEVIVQIRATDLADHSQTAQLTITVLDVNDEKPRLVVSSAIEIEENQLDGFLLSTSISATDEDKTADLIFSIDWNASYATKNSQRLSNETFQTIQCIDVKTIPGATNQEATLELSIKETQKGNTPDYEVFDNLYLNITVNDQNTEQNSYNDSALIVITVLNKNDNSPEFAEGTETAKRQVTENSATGTVITSVIATDADLLNPLTYSIESFDEDSPLWVAIDSDTGTITVNLAEGDKIDCDEPVRYSLKYNVTASDGERETSVTITIDINDQNELAPTMPDLTQTIQEEDGTARIILPLEPQDGDRDLPFHTVQCLFSSAISADVTNRFKVVNNSITVDLQEGFRIDREELTQFTFDLSCLDDPTQQSPLSNQINPPPKVTIILQDINDNPPTITNTQITGLDENTGRGPIGTKILGYDPDEGDNGTISFVAVKQIKRFIEGDDNEQPAPPQDLFVAENAGNSKDGILSINAANLRGYYGNLVLTISLTDEGTPPLPNDVDVTLEVLKFNFMEPIFTYPSEGDTIYLQTIQDANSALKLFSGVSMENFVASDQQDNKYGVSFEVIEDSSDRNVFRVVTLGNSNGQLQVTATDFDIKPYTLKIRAYMNADPTSPGNAQFSKNCTINIDFFDQDATDPIFNNHEGNVGFPENLNGQTYQVENATYSKPDLPSDLPKYYLLRDGDSTLFKIDAKTGLLTLLQELDYEETKSYDVVIQSSNSENIKPNAIEDTKFYLTINVVDVNDNPPIFDSKDYVTTLTVTGNTDTTVSVQRISAHDADATSQDNLEYSITSSTGSNDELNTIPNPFTVDYNGFIRPTFNAKESFEGYFTLNVTVQDESVEDDHKDFATVKIYLVTSKNTVNFKFENDQETVRAATESNAIKNILDEAFATNSYQTNVEAAQADQSENGNPRTISPIFFLDEVSNVPVDATEIYKKVTDVNFFRTLKQSFVNEGLLLLSFDSDAGTTQNLEATLKAWLIGVAVVLGSLCLILLIAFILKTRALNQRINKLTNTKFGSQESGLNRTGLAAPTTNKHAVEGSNPVYNNEADAKDIDRTSVTSGDSDLIGIEDDDKFNYNNYPTKDEIMD